MLGSRFSTAAGGKGANQAVAASRLGAQVTMVGCVGNDPYGEILLQGLNTDGVETRFVRKAAGSHTGVALITVAEGGENSIIVISGANWQLTTDDVARAVAEIAAADLLVLQLETPLEVVDYAVRVALDQHVPVVLNPAPARPLPSDLLASVDYLVLNESEASLLSGGTVNDLASAEKAAEHIRQQGVGVVILTRGSRGAFVSAKTGSFTVPAFPVTPVDTTAAGDAFVGGLAYGLALKKPLPEAARFAAAAGGLATTKVGAQPSLPGVDEVERLLLAHPERR